MYKKIHSWQNLLNAYRKAATGKRGQPNVAAFAHRLEDNLCLLKEELEQHRYKPGSYASFHIHAPKRRLISAAPFRDRVVHHALCNVIEPRFQASFIRDSYANQKGKGTHRALRRCQQFARAHRYFLQCDIVKFFPAVDHTSLVAILRKHVQDGETIALIEAILRSGEGVLSDEYEMVWFPGDNLFAALRPRGLPIGNLTSQFWANCYLNPFDHFAKTHTPLPRLSALR
jgi:RNA-directed DNA polymerase